MTKNKISINKILIAGLISGFVFAGIMALFDLYNQKPFSLWKFILFFLWMGAFNGFLQYRAQRKLNKNNPSK
jgi:hypothetical protein